MEMRHVYNNIIYIVCNPSKCSVYLENQVVAFPSKSGDGTSCITGNKLWGMNPLTDGQQKELEQEQPKCNKKNKWSEIIDNSIKRIKDAAIDSASRFAEKTTNKIIDKF